MRRAGDRCVHAAVAGTLAAGVIVAGGCTSGHAVSADAERWAPPRGSMVTHDFDVTGRSLDGRRDDQLGYPPRRPETFTVTTIEQRARLSTTGNGRITDSVSRRVRSRIYLEGP